MIQIIFILLFGLAFIGCNSKSVNLSEEPGPEGQTQLSSRVDGSQDGKIRVPGKVRIQRRGKAHQQIKNKTDKDLINPPGGQTKAKWVNDLNRRVVIPKVGKVKIIKNGKYIVRRVVSDDVVPAPPPARPQWVDRLAKKVSPPKIKAVRNGKFISSHAAVGTDLVGGRGSSASGGGRGVSPQVDIIVSVDSSDSMYLFLSDVRKTFKNFIPALAPLDWRIIFVDADYATYMIHKNAWYKKHLRGSSGENHNALWTRDYHQGQVLPLEDDGELLAHQVYLSKKVKNHQSVFIDTLRQHDFDEYTDWGPADSVDSCELSPGCGSLIEQPLKKLKVALQSRYMAALRPSANKVLVVISDTDESGRVHGKTQAQEIVNLFRKKYTGTFKAYGILLKPGDLACQKQAPGWFYRNLDKETEFSTELSRLAKLTGGANFSICNKSYTPLAKKIVADFL